MPKKIIQYLRGDNMFVPRKEYTEYEYKSLRLPKELVERAQNVAEMYELSFNKIVIQCMEYALNEMIEINGENSNTNNGKNK